MKRTQEPSARAAHRGETDTHRRLKRLALVWAQANGYSACVAEMTVPKSRYRVDVAAYRFGSDEPGVTAIFECKQALPDLRRDNCCGDVTRERLLSISRRRAVLEKHLRVHYPTLRTGDSLFPEYDSYNLSIIGHRAYSRVLREFTILQQRLGTARKFESLVRYRCANLFFLVLPDELFSDTEVPIGWGALVESGQGLTLVRKPIWHENSIETRFHFLQRLAAAGTRQFNRSLGITREQIVAVANAMGISLPGD